MTNVIKLNRVKATNKENLINFLKEVPEEYMEQIVMVGLPTNLEDTDYAGYALSNFEVGRDELLALDYLMGFLQDQMYSVEE